MVNTGCVLVEGDEGSDKFLVAYIVSEGETSHKEVRAALKKRLPFYMIPSRFIFIDRQVTQHNLEVTLGLCTSCFFPSVYQNGGNTERN
jgi:acyl-CoA synthetase (AMP-forming)/AMP-acid ligase II